MMLDMLIRLFLRSSPRSAITPDAQAAFQKLLESVDGYGGELRYDLPYDKSDFISYVASTGGYLFHGSNGVDIDVLEPREQTLFDNRIVNAVFASSEAMWSCFYAVFDRSKLIGSFRNGCLNTRRGNYHYYSLNSQTLDQQPWTSGMLYILPRASFARSGHGRIPFDEWISYNDVRPLCKLRVSVEDFHFKDRVARHHPKESMVKTMLMYKWRTRS